MICQDKFMRLNLHKRRTYLDVVLSILEKRKSSFASFLLAYFTRKIAIRRNRARTFSCPRRVTEARIRIETGCEGLRQNLEGR